MWKRKERQQQHLVVVGERDEQEEQGLLSLINHDKQFVFVCIQMFPTLILSALPHCYNVANES